MGFLYSFYVLLLMAIVVVDGVRQKRCILAIYGAFALNKAERTAFVINLAPFTISNQLFNTHSHNGLWNMSLTVWHAIESKINL